jgi:hypothetical protein
MGFYSWNCNECGVSVISAYARCPVTSWQMDCVAVFENGDVIKGEYDGYGRILSDHGEFELYGDFALYHRACWEAAGCPTKFTEAAKGAGDQGFFFSDASHDFAPPGTPNPDEWVRERQVEREKIRERQELAEISHDWYDICYEHGVDA